MAASDMEFNFKRSLVVMGQLAQAAARTPPSEDDPPLEYVDRSLTVLGWMFDAYNQKIGQEFLSQREFIASQFREVDRRFEEMEKKMEKRMDGRFEEMEKRIDGRFQEVNGRFEEVNERFEEVNERFEEVNERFREVDRRFDKQDVAIRDVKVQLENAAAITRNGRLRRMHQPINLIRVLKPADDPDTFVWTSHPQVPKHLKNAYLLAQRAKGVFEPSWEGKSNLQSTYLSHSPVASSRTRHRYLYVLLVSLHSHQQNAPFLSAKPTLQSHQRDRFSLKLSSTEAQAKQKALRTINELANFYNVVLWSDDESESDATEVVLHELTVDEYMEVLLAEWGIDWQKVVQLGTLHMQDRPQQAGAKRAGDASARGVGKRTRGVREEEESG